MCGKRRAAGYDRPYCGFGLTDKGNRHSCDSRSSDRRIIAACKHCIPKEHHLVLANADHLGKARKPVGLVDAAPCNIERSRSTDTNRKGWQLWLEESFEPLTFAKIGIPASFLVEWRLLAETGKGDLRTSILDPIAPALPGIQSDRRDCL